MRPRPSRITPPVGPDALGEGVGQSSGLLVDLLEHEGLVPALLGRLVVPVDRPGPAGSTGVAIEIEDLDRVAADHHHVPVLREEHGRVSARKAGMAEAMKFSPSPRPTTSGVSLRMPTITSGSSTAMAQYGEVALHLPVGLHHRLAERALVGPLDQVGHHLGVGLGGEGVPLGLELGPQAQVVLHDAVEHDGEAPGAVGVRMGVLGGRPAVGGPARVRDAQGAAASPIRSRMASRLSRLPTECSSSKRPSADDGDAGGIVAAVLELAQPAEQDVPAGPITHIPDDATHQ